MGAGASAIDDTDNYKIRAQANVGILKDMFAQQVEMATGKVDPAMLAEAQVKFASYMAPKIKWIIGGTAGEGDFGACMMAMGGYWMGIENKAIKNTTIAVDVDDANTISWAQVYEAVVNGNPMTLDVTHVITLDGESKICAWNQMHDTKKLADARAAAPSGDTSSSDAASADDIEFSRVTKVPIKEGTLSKVVEVSSKAEFKDHMKTFVGFKGAEMYALGEDHVITHSRWVSKETSDGGVAALGSVLKEFLAEFIAGPPAPMAVGPVAFQFGSHSDEISAYRVLKIALKDFDAALAVAQSKVEAFEKIDGLTSIRFIKQSDTECLVCAGYMTMDQLEKASEEIQGHMKSMAEHFAGPPESIGHLPVAWRHSL